jgi:diguanylate cyclase (GGDEF)-like protein
MNSAAPAAAPALVGVAQGGFDPLLEALAEAQGLGLAIKDALDGRYLQVSAGMAALFALPAEAWIGRSDDELFDPAIAAALRSADQAALGLGKVQVSDHRFDWRGERRELSVLRRAHQAGERRVIVSVWQDNAPARRREAQLRTVLEQLEQEQKANQALRREVADLGLHDRASGLYTRSHFEDQIRREVDLSTREHREFALVHIALDPFSPEVEAAGERGRERISEAMGRLLRGNTRAMDASCRLDDGHFAVLLSGVGLATSHSRMEGLRRQCATQIVVLDGEELGFTVSMGVASFPHTASNQAELIAASQAARGAAPRREHGRAGGDPVRARNLNRLCANARAAENCLGGPERAQSLASTARHSSSLTGVIDSRLPGLSTTIVASSGAWRSSRSDSSRVLRTRRTSTWIQRGCARLDFGS